MTEPQKFKTVITSEHKLLDLHIKETFQYRDLIMLYVKRSFIASYKQTILGPAWAIINPLLTTVVFTIVFGKLARLTTADAPGDFLLPGFLFYMAGNICWSYFSSTLQKISGTFLNYSGTFGKVYYPRLVIPVSTAISDLISFGIQFALFVILWIYFSITGGASVQITTKLLLIPVVLLHMMVLAVGCGIIISAVTTKYRDLQMLVAFGIQLWHYATPVAYGLQLVPEQYLGIYLLNPVTPIITTFRYAVFGFGFFDLKYYLISWLVSIAIFIFGLLLFSKVERTFLDTI